MESNFGIEKEFGWNDTIEKESDYILLPEGDYEFTVESFERGRYDGSPKLPPCNKATLKLKIETQLGPAYINHQLFLHSKTEGMLSAFFAAIGQKKKGAPLQMNWATVPGSKGRCKAGIKEYNNVEYNEVKKFYTKDDSKGYTPGSF